MEYYPYQQVQHRLPQTAYTSGLYHTQNPRFQQPQQQQVREIPPQFQFQGHRWMDPYARNSLLQSHRTETKPRLSKGEVEQLEAEFQKNNKPTSNVKKGLAEQMRVEVARINVVTSHPRLPLIMVVACKPCPGHLSRLFANGL